MRLKDKYFRNGMMAKADNSPYRDGSVHHNCFPVVSALKQGKVPYASNYLSLPVQVWELSM